MKKNAAHYRRLAVGAAMAAGAAWGVSFLAPRALGDVDSATLSLFRFLFFGASSLVAFAVHGRSAPAFSWRLAGKATVLAATGHSAYYFLLALGVKGAGVSVAVSIIGLLPLTILMASTAPTRWIRLTLPMVLIAGGGILIGWDLFRGGAEALDFAEGGFAERAVGVAACFAALGLWTYFAVANANFLKQHPEWRSLDWAGILGVIAAFLSLVIFFAAEGDAAWVRLALSARDPRLLLWAGFMGVVGAWGATALWNFASKHLSGAWLGQLLVFESIFGLLFGFLYDERGPRLLEGLAIIALLGGVVIGLRYLGDQPER